MKEDPGLSADGWFRSDHMTYPYGLHAAVVSIDAGTGNLAVERFIVGYDVGRALNPTLVEGQIAGGVAQGLGERSTRSSCTARTEPRSARRSWTI